MKNDLRNCLIFMEKNYTLYYNYKIITYSHAWREHEAFPCGVLYEYCGGKIYQTTVGLGPRAESSHNKKGKRDRKTFSPILLGRTCLRGVRGGVSPRTHQMGVQHTPCTR